MNDENNQPRDLRFVPPKPQREVDDELRYHLERRVQAYIDAGMQPDAARQKAYARFGDLNEVRETCTELLTENRRAESRRDLLDDIRADLRFAIRSAVRAPMFALGAIITLALGIGANAAVFGVVKSVLLDPLPYADASQLMRVSAPFRNGTFKKGSLSGGTMSDLRERQHSFSTLGAFQQSRDVTYIDQTPQIMKAMFVEPALFRTLGVSPIRGRNFTDEEAQHDTALFALVSYGTWQRTFGGDANLIGRVIRVNGFPRTVVGVLPRSFVPPEGEADFYFPFNVASMLRNPISARGSHSLGAIGRLKPGVSVDAAHRELTSIGDELEKLYPKDNLGIGLDGTSLRDAMVGDTRTPLIVLLGSASLVLLIMCANLAGALLSRTISRRREFAVRAALGAGRGRLVRQLLTESVALAITGAVLGLLLASVGLGLVRQLAATTLPSYANLSLDAGAVGVTFVLALLTGIAFGVGPALAVGRADPQGTLREQTRGASESRRTRRMRGVLVAGQIALCVSLLAAAGLLTRSLWTMMTAPAGFNPDHLLTFRIQLPNVKYPSAKSNIQFNDQFLQSLRALPGVQSASTTSYLPTAVRNSNGLVIQAAPWGPNEPVPFILTDIVTEDYFKTIGVSLVSGRNFAQSDNAETPSVMVINKAMAKKYWPKGNAVGAQVHIGPPDPNAPWITVVGIVSDVRNNPATLEPEPMMFLSRRQEGFGDQYVVRTTNDPLAATGSVRAALAALDPTLPMYNVSTMNDVIDQAYTARRLPVVLMMAFGALALLLASVGVYAMFATMTAAREREFGVRVALGSTPREIAMLVVRQGSTWLAVGLAVGAIGMVAIGRLIQTQLVGVAAFDPLTIGAAIAVLMVCATAALLMPVRRASKVDPITVLR